MTQGPDIAAEYSTFEVTLPKGVNDSTLALYGLGSALGWNIKERVAYSGDLLKGDIPAYFQINRDDLLNVSEGAFGTPVYGENAGDFLDEEKRTIQERLFVYTHGPDDNDEVSANSDIARYAPEHAGTYSYKIGSYSAKYRSHGATEDGYERQILENFLNKLWPLTPFPFEVPHVELSKKPRWENMGDAYQFWNIIPGPVSRARLANYSRVKGIAQHALHGAMAKSLDVINVAAGLVDEATIQARKEEPQSDLMDFIEFRTNLKNSGLSRYAQEEIIHTITWSLEDQVHTGNINRWQPQIIVDGRIRWVTAGNTRVVQPDRIARTSLAHLLDEMPETRHVAARQFLEEYTA
jgi:hypothetical protein